ncbi:hypothetical protein OE88DRAFT_511029 [Heliocybe sulcata]|uniref:Uncharacterized protein n=1 Tax=Heliocybe sulcata TaxID=5364 RepID=A0A5C3MV65_9AGAM|nr:hypothetical protein OE88DRAFT_511029 [Heliocybe sulcata]
MQQWQVWGALMMSELSMEDYLPEDFEATLRPMYEFVDRKLQNHPSASVEHQLWQYIDRDPPDSRYAWWINAYPVEWREALARLLPEDWQCMHNAYAVLSRSNSPQPVQEAKVEVEGGDRVDLRTLLGAVLWLLHTARNASHLDCWDRWTRSCYRLQRIWTKLPPHSCGWVVEDFFDDLRQSKHTCYGMYGDGITALHAAAYSFLYGASALTVRPLLARTKSDPVLIKCPACLLCLFTSDSTGSVGIGSANSAYNTLRQEKLQWYSSVIAVEKPSPEDRDYEQWRRDWRPFFKCLLRCPPKFYKVSVLSVLSISSDVVHKRLIVDRMRY